jgi:hypothetical protein
VNIGRLLTCFNFIKNGASPNIRTTNETFPSDENIELRPEERHEKTSAKTQHFPVSDDP